MEIPTDAGSIKEYFGGLIDDTTAEMLEEYIKNVKNGERVELRAKGRVVVEGVVKRVFPVKTFQRRGRSGKIGSAILYNNTRVVFWNEAAGVIEAGDVVEGAKLIVKGYIKDEEVHVNSPMDVEIRVEFTKIGDLKPGAVNVKGRVSGIGEPEKANEIFLSDETGRVKVVLESHSELYFKVDIGDEIEIMNGIVEEGRDGLEIHVKRNSKVRVGE